MKKHKLLALLFSLAGTLVAAQNVAINNDGSPADVSAILDVKSQQKGVLVPRMTEALRNAIPSPATSLVIYQTDITPGFYYNSGTPGAPVWKKMGEDLLPPSSIVLSETKPNSALENAGFSAHADVYLTVKNAVIPANTWTELNMENGLVDDEASYVSVNAGDYIVMAKSGRKIMEVYAYRISTNTWSKTLVTENMDYTFTNEIICGDQLVTDGNLVYSLPPHTKQAVLCNPTCYYYGGFRYNPVNNEILSFYVNTGHNGRRSYSPVVAGTKILYWGGYDNDLNTFYNDGLLYNIAGGSWSVLPNSPVLGPRRNAAAVWTGTEVIIFGGENNGVYQTDGAKLDLGSNTWTAIASNPSITFPIRYAHWNGTEMFVFGSSGYKYNPQSNTWTALNAGLDALSFNETYAWTGTEYWRYNPFTQLITRFDPGTNSVSSAHPGGPVFFGGGSVNFWCGNKLFVQNYYHPALTSRFFYPALQTGVSANRTYYLYKKN